MAEEKEVGKITHYYDKIGVAVVELKAALKAGDSIHVKGHATDFTQNVESMQIEHEEIQEAKKGDHIGMKVNEEVREHDVVYKVAG